MSLRLQLLSQAELLSLDLAAVHCLRPILKQVRGAQPDADAVCSVMEPNLIFPIHTYSNEFGRIRATYPFGFAHTEALCCINEGF